MNKSLWKYSRDVGVPKYNVVENAPLKCEWSTFGGMVPWGVGTWWTDSAPLPGTCRGCSWRGTPSGTAGAQPSSGWCGWQTAAWPSSRAWRCAATRTTSAALSAREDWLWVAESEVPLVCPSSHYLQPLTTVRLFSCGERTCWHHLSCQTLGSSKIPFFFFWFLNHNVINDDFSW